MTGPKPVKLPHIQQGNTLTDLSQGMGNFVGGLQAERDKERAYALEQALADARMAQATRGNPPGHIQIRGPDGLPQWAMVDQDGIVSPTRLGPTGQPAGAPESNYMFQTEDNHGHLGIGAIPRHALPTQGQPTQGQPPAQAATSVPMPKGVEPRDFSPTIAQVETPTGPHMARIRRRQGAPEILDVQPRAQATETRKASDAFDMIQGYHGMKQSLQTDPKAAQDAAAYIASLNIAEDIPLVGHTMQDILEHARNLLTPGASQYFQAFMQFAAARAFARGGATLTRNEIDYALAALAPRIGDPDNVTRQRDDFTRGVIHETILGSGSAWQRYREAARALGYEDYNGPSIPPTPMQINPRFQGRQVP